MTLGSNFDAICSCSLGLTIFTLLTFSNSAYGQTIQPNASSDPTSIAVGNDFDLNIVIANKGSHKETISSITIPYPSWKITKNVSVPFDVGPNQYVIKTLTLHLPRELKAGLYHVYASVNTGTSQFLTNSTVDVKTFQSFPLTGELPVAVIGVIIPGITAYFIIYYLRLANPEIDKIQIDIPMMLLIGVAFGIVSWFLIGKTIDEVGSSSIFEYAAAEGIAIALAIGFSYIWLAFVWILKKSRKVQESLENRGQIRELKSIRIRYTSKAWMSILNDNVTNVRKTLGAGYNIKTKVVYKDDTGTRREIEALLWKFDQEPPYNIALRPKYLSKCNNKTALIPQLGTSIKETIKDKDHRDYAPRLEKEFFGGVYTRTDQMVEAISTKLDLASSAEDFIGILNKLDFSLHTKRLIDQMKLPLQKMYGHAIFISADNIVSVEFIVVEPTYQIELTSRWGTVLTSIIIPESIGLTDPRFQLR
jgi:hypothetical protein